MNCQVVVNHVVELTAEEKASVSHRGKALRAFAAALDDYLKGNE